MGREGLVHTGPAAGLVGGASPVIASKMEQSKDLGGAAFEPSLQVHARLFVLGSSLSQELANCVGSKGFFK